MKDGSCAWRRSASLTVKPFLVGDRPDDAFADHQLDRVLHEEERRAHVDGHHPVEELGLRVPDGAPLGVRRAVGEYVQGAEMLVGGRDDAAAGVHVDHVGLDEDGLAAAGVQFLGGGLAAVGISAGDDDAGRTALGEELGGGAAEALGAPRDDGIPAGKRIRVGH